MTRALLLIRAYFFSWIGAGGFILPFVTLFYQDRGLTGSQIGVLVAATGIASLIMAPIWGRWSDAARRPIGVLQLALLGSGISMLLLGLQNTYPLIMLFAVGNALLGGGIEPLSTSQALAVTNREKAGYGSIRLWGSLGYALMAPISGWLIERSGLFTPFIGFLLGMLASIAILAPLARRGLSGSPRYEEFLAESPERPTQAPSTSLKLLIVQLAHNRRLAGMALALTILWISTAGRIQFEAIYMKQLGASESVIGLASTLGALIELPGMLLADRLVRRYGAGVILRSSLLMQAGAMLLVLLFPSVTAILVMRGMSGFFFSFYTVSSIAYLVQDVPERQASTVLALFMVTLRGLVGLVGAPLAGVLFDLNGAYWLYGFALLGSLAGWLVLRITATPKPSLSAA